MTITSPTESSKGGRRANALPVGHMLDEYRIDAILGAGGFGVTYKALDIHLDTWVAIKEYFPVEWSFRDSDGITVLPNTQGDTSGGPGELSDYRWGLERFLDEARVLARIQHPYVVRVKRYFQAHGTAYIVMDYEEGQPLSAVLQEDEILGEDEVRGLLEDVLPALQAVHEQGYLHRDVKPSNLYVRASDQRVILIDFGAARQAVGRHSQSVTSLVTPGYSPPEQYTTRQDRYGTWTDIYALGAVLYRCITGHAPAEAADRLLDDNMEPAVRAGAGRYSTNLLRVIDQMLAVRPERRLRTVADMQAALTGSQDDDSDETVIMMPITPAKPVQMSRASRVTGRVARSVADPVKPEAARVTGRIAKPAADPAQADHSDWRKMTPPSLDAHPSSVEQWQNTGRKTAFRWRLPAIVVGGVVLAMLAAMLIWFGLSEPASEPKPPPRYRLGQQESSAPKLLMTTETPTSTTIPPLSPPISDVADESPAEGKSAETTNPLVLAEEPTTGSAPEAVAENGSELASSLDLPATESGFELNIKKETSGTMDSQEPPVAENRSEPVAVAEDLPETAHVAKPTAGAMGALPALGMIPAEVAPKVDAATKPVNKRAVDQESKAPKSAQRPQQTAEKNTRPWKVIPYDQSMKKPTPRPAKATPKRDDLWDAPSSSGFNQR